MNPHSIPSAGKVPDIASLSIPETLKAFNVNAEVRLMRTEVEIRRKEYGYNIVN